MNSIFNDPGFWHRLQFGFTIVYHYLFPQLTMGLASFIVYWKWRALRTGAEKYNQAVRFWAKIFGLNFAVGAIGAFYALRGLHPVQARLYLRAGTFVGLIASLLVAFPTGDQQAKIVGNHQPITLAAMEGKFEGGSMAGVALIGQPNVTAQRLDNPIEVPGALSFLAYGHFGSFVHGLNDFPKDQWPDNLELLYYSFHIMITLGTLFIVLMGFATLQNWRGKLESSRLLLWVLMLEFYYTYIFNTLGWMTAELGRQPWLIYGLFHTRDGYSKVVSNGDAIFTLIGFTGLYFVLGLLFLALTGREIAKGPEERTTVVVDPGEAVLV